MLLVYPIASKKEPPSLWSNFFPRSVMKWEWDQDGDTRVSDLWHLRAELSVSGKVVYTKWYQGRATFFSKELFTAFLCVLHFTNPIRAELSTTAHQILDLLNMDSPLSTKEIRRATELTGKFLAPVYDKSLKELWNRLLIVGFGEVEDGAFPSLAIGSSKLLFEELWNEASLMKRAKAFAIIEKKQPPTSLFLKYLTKRSVP